MSSRVEDRAERHAEEVRNAERQNKELQQKKRTEEATAFDRALASKSKESAFAANRTAQRASEQARTAQGGGEAHAAEIGGQELPPTLDAPPPMPGESVAARRARLAREASPQAFSSKLAEKQERGEAPPQVLQTKAETSQQTSDTLLSRGKENLAQSQAKAEVRSEALTQSSQKEQRAESQRQADGRSDQAVAGERSAASSGAQSRGRVGRAGDEQGGSGGRDSKGGDDREQKSSTFRIPPAALMAPPPVARPRDANAARFRAISKEIVDKIVSRVMVGTNAQGIPEFRLELKSSVLKGLSIKVSGGRGGKIRAVFSGSDKEVLAALKQSSDALAEALQARGLTLEELVIEEAQT